MPKPFLAVLLALLAALLASLALPAASAQGQATSSVTLAGLPTGTFQTNETLAVFDFTLTYAVNNLVCVGQGATVTVALTAGVQGNGSENFTATVVPGQMTFTVPPTQGVSGYSQQQSGTLTVRPDAVVQATSNVTAVLSAAVTNIAGCAGATADQPSDEAEVPLQFLRVRGAEVEPGQELPGPGLPLVLLGLVALAMLARRSD